jgi:hypothetical protein
MPFRRICPAPPDDARALIQIFWKNGVIQHKYAGRFRHGIYPEK